LEEFLYFVFIISTIILRYLTKKYGAHVEGITLSTWQVQRAIELTSAEGLSDKVQRA
jgi:cyclopropane fatty-acyl-phospholipid synthase-like methyltransferase